MKAVRRGVLMIAFSVLVGACNNPSGPSGDSYAGQWSGTTAQGKPLTFTISTDEKVTAITVGHEFNGCSGTQTFSSLSVSIVPQVQCIPGPCSNQLASYRAFSYSSARSLEEQSTNFNAVFMSPARVEGMVSFRGFPGCGDAVGISWSATKR